MLPHKYHLQNLYNQDDSNGQNPETQQAKEGENKTEEKLFTQADVDKFTGSARKDGKEKAIKSLLEELEIPDTESLKKLFKSLKEQEEAKKTDDQKKSDEIAKLKADLDAERKAKQEEIANRRNDKRDAELNLMLLDARSSKQVMTLLKAEHAEALNALILEDGNFDKGGAEKLLTEFRKENGHLFRDTQNPGSPSNNNGKPPQPNKEAQDLAKKEIETKFRL